MSTNCECYKKLGLVAVIAAVVATMLVATMVAVDTIFVRNLNDKSNSC